MRGDIEDRMAPLPPDTDRTEGQLAHLLPALWRTVVRATRMTQDVPALDSQMSLIRVLVSNGPTAPTALADELRLARPTISNLLKRMVSAGSVERHSSELDGRSVVIVPTELGRQTLEDFRNDRTEVIGEALAAMTVAQQRQIAQSLPVLRELLHQLVLVVQTAESDTRSDDGKGTREGPSVRE